MQKKYYIFIIILTIYFRGFGQFAFPPSSPQSSGMGNISASLKDWRAASDNIAALPLSGKTSIALSLSQYYMLPEMSYKTITFAIPTSKINALGMHYTNFGTPSYNEQRLAIQYAQLLGKSISIGLELDYLHCGTSDIYYDKYHRITFATALQLYLSKDLTLGFYAFNPLSVNLNETYNQKIPTIIKIGMGYNIAPQLLAAVEFEKNIYMKHCINTGLEYKAFEFLDIRIGFSSQPIIYSVGIGFKRKSWSIDFSTQMHNQLGISPSIAVAYIF